MTISLDERRRQQRAALEVFIEDIGDDYAMGHILKASDARFGTVDESTWTELKRSYVEPMNVGSGASYKLTYARWLKGIQPSSAFSRIWRWVGTS